MSVKIFIAIVSYFYVSSQLNFSYGQDMSDARNKKPNTSIPVDTLQVSVDNHKMSMYVSGSGKYTVVLEAGGAANHR